MKVNKLFKNDGQKFVYSILFIIIICAFIYLGTVNFKSGTTDGEKFSMEFSSVESDNVFVYSTPAEIVEKIEGDAIVLFGSSKNEFTEQYANIINEVAKESNVGKILYYDFISDRTNNNGNYELIVEALKPYLLTDDLGNTEIYAPTFLVIKDGNVLYINEDVNFVVGDITPEMYWTDLVTGTFKETLKTVFSDFFGEE